MSHGGTTDPRGSARVGIMSHGGTTDPRGSARVGIMSHGGTTDPCGSVQVYSIGALGKKNKEHSAAIGNFLESKLNIPQDRFYITYMDIAGNDCGYEGDTFG
ncbi:macrophage migration inhibitory factor homolog isoform X5 [Dreissena polymorpha]|uniref:macrophage migration inhibitory factor homolog isoform X3 n=1 Tax=Dreissena polymorpha TaxID=45954 RepID=UPI002264E706|nr:macrophage migration inhibitory factor homolog isoform X3 [Dreissena polymorpha]XP_052242400.1 macrophage migration inhibitory factor homolog isoform X4 [Dreissena polymorpha]XP_052242408.1 macrophage migration inhibitory factor homolog isoform X5 [Dreissena polymorpha]